MVGDGIDMYDLIVGLKENDPQLYSTSKKFWVGVIEKIYPSPPVPRRKTRSYEAADVYLFLDKQIFSMPKRDDNGNFVKEFYDIPERELIFVR